MYIELGLMVSPKKHMLLTITVLETGRRLVGDW